MKIYTKTGDKGETSLLGGVRVSKTDDRIYLLGQIDKLNSYIGIILAYLNKLQVPKIQLMSQVKILNDTQNLLFEIGSEIAKEDLNISEILKERILNITHDLETQIDLMCSNLLELKNFILPGGSLISSEIHLVRSVTREIEIEFVKNKEVFDFQEFRIFLNRLSDYFFTLARFVNKLEGFEDVIWYGKQ